MAPRTARRCPYCDTAIEPSATFCSHCGNTLPAIGATQMLPPTRTSVQRGSPLLWVITIAVLGVVLGLVGVLWSQTSRRTLPDAPVVIIVTATPQATTALMPRETDIPAPLNTSVLPTIPSVPTPMNSISSPLIGLIPFRDPNNPDILNSFWGWQPGSSTASDYSLEMNPGALTLIGGSGSSYWGGNFASPLLLHSVQGDFEAQVKVVGLPKRDIQGFRFGVRSSQDRSTWVAITRASQDNIGGQLISASMSQQGNSRLTNITPYPNDTVYLKLSRTKSLFTLSYSVNGNNWVTLEKNYVFELSIETEIFFSIESTPPDGFIIELSDFIMLK